MSVPSRAELAARLDALERLYETYLAWTGVILSALTFFVIVAGFFSFVYIRREAAQAAREEARATATDIAETRVDDYLHREAPRILRETVELQYLSASSAHGEDIMEASDDEDGR